MYNGLKYALVFSMGVATGIVVSWKTLEAKYKQIAQEEIDSVKEVYSKKASEEACEEVVEEDASPVFPTEDEKEQMKEIIDQYVGEGGSEAMKFSAPYVIPPEEHGEIEEYETESWTYYADGVITDEQDRIVENVADIIGIDPLDHFGEYEEDSVFVRNEFLRCDYEILRDLRPYDEAKETFLSPIDE